MPRLIMLSALGVVLVVALSLTAPASVQAVASSANSVLAGLLALGVFAYVLASVAGLTGRRP